MTSPGRLYRLHANEPAYDAIKSEIAVRCQVEGATVSRGYHLRVSDFELEVF